MLKVKLFGHAFLALLVVILATANLSGQTPDETGAPKGSIKGRVIDAAGSVPLAGTTVIVEGTAMGTIADADGGFTISNITPGRVTITATYLGYEVFRRAVVVEGDSTVTLEIPLHAGQIDIEDVVVVAHIDNESENVQLSGQRQALMAIRSIGAAEMSRKGIGNAEAAVAQVSGVSRQQGVKNVFVRGLGDRYNATFLNGFPLPSEDPEYKNIALEFFGSDVIRNIGVNKVFGATTGGDVGGAAIDIRSKELVGARALSVSLGAGVDGKAVGSTGFLRQDGTNYFGTSRAGQPTAGKFDFPNRLDPVRLALPVNHNYGVSAGRQWMLGKAKNPLSIFVVASHSTDYTHTEQKVRNATAGDLVTQDQRGAKSSIGTDQLVLANARFEIGRRHDFDYNFMLVHAGDQWVGEYNGTNNESFQDAHDEKTGFMRRQQSNDNLLMTHQLSAKTDLSDRVRIEAGMAVNTIKGVEPDRRENYLSLASDGRWLLTLGNSQKRFFSTLDERDLNLRAAVSFRLKEGVDIENSNVTAGYIGRMVDDGFRAREYNMGAYPRFVTLEGLRLDELYNAENYAAGEFSMTRGGESSYNVAKYIHSAYIETTHRFSDRLSGVAGLRVDAVDMRVDYNVETVPPGASTIDRPFWLPSLALRYDFAENHSLRLGASRSYTLPQSKEIAPYQYVNIGFASEGNPNLRPSDNYNVDVKWDWYIGPSEIASLGTFYKRIIDPIGRLDVGGSARLLSYDNISDAADVAGAELEVRKNIINTTTIRSRMRRLSIGFNASWIFSRLDFRMASPVRQSRLEGASPFLAGGDISYNVSSGEKAFNVSLVAGWFSDRIHTLGTRMFNDTIEEGHATLSAVSSWRFNKWLTVKLKADNLLDPAHRLTRRNATGPGKMTLSEHRKGVDVSLGVTFDIF